VQQAIDAVQKITKTRIKVVTVARRAGDPARLVADATRARKELGWVPMFPELETIVAHAWNWELKQSVSHQEHHPTEYQASGTGP
jgi:UDP-glucose 4-epimerase